MNIQGKLVMRNSKLAGFIFLGLALLSFLNAESSFAQTNGPVVFQSFDFAELRGPIGHEALVPVSGNPIAGNSQTVTATLTGSFDTAAFRLVSLSGSNLQSINLTLPFDDGRRTGFGEFTGSFTPPDQPFQVGVSGVDTDGVSYNILFSKIFTPQTVEVNFDRTTANKSGDTSTLFIDVTNHGDSGSFSIDVTDIAIDWTTQNPRGEITGLITRVSPVNFSLGRGATRSVEVDIRAPSGTPVNTGVILTAVASNTSDPDISNKDILTFPVVVDTTPPRVTPPSNKSVNSTGSLTPVNIGQATATDDVGVFFLSNNSTGLFPVGIHEVTWVALDAAGNIGTATQVVTVTGEGGTDSTPPVIIPPPNVTAAATGSQTVVALGTATATDNVSAPGDIAITENAPSSFPLGSTQVTWTATDEAGNSATGIQTVTVTEGGGSGNGQTTLDIRVASSSDDAEERATGSMSLASSDLELAFDGGGNQKIGLRFRGVNIPQGATITNAYVQFQADEKHSGTTVLTVRGQDAANPKTFTSASNNISSRSLTTASVPWSPVPWNSVGEAGSRQQTPDISSVIQEIVDLPEWASGNPLVVILNGTGERAAESFDGLPGAAALLHLVFSSGSGGSVSVPGVVGQSQAAAESDITGAGLTVGNASTTSSATVPTGDVISQNPTGGTSVTPGSSVNLVVSSGSGSVSVPGVVGQSQAAAESNITGAGLTVGNASTTSSATVPTGDVISQNPAGGTSVAPGSSVNLVVSSGSPGSEGVLDIRIASSSDDGEERATGSMSLTSSDLELTFDAGGNQVVGLRFQGVNIPQGATITNAYVQFQADEKHSGATSLTVRGQDAANPKTFTSASNNISSRSLTTASVPWSPVPWNSLGESGTKQRTPDISSIVQEIINLPQWASGNPLAVIISGTGERAAESFDSTPSGAPLLHVVFSSGSPGPIPVPAVVGQSQAAAESAITGAGLAVGTVTTKNSSSVSVGSVISQNPTAGSNVGPGSAVNLVVSAGSPGSGETLDIRISSGSDDAEERISGSVNRGSSDLELVFDRGGPQSVGLRFRGVGIPNCSTITKAYIQFQTDETHSGPTSLTVRGHDTDNAGVFRTTTNNITSRSLTTASVAWSPAPWDSVGEAGPNQRTPDISSIVQEIIDRSGWESGNSLAVIINGTGERVAESYNGVSSAAPLLHVEYVTSPCS
ncbi:MAG: hypothetical protein NPINA01_14560 [Nitrospinaceae bacterium]|nr:MAG: hypothetical protein NPINA01_14560 [Nitrospinaceae bacterium]